jgi:hypothetical protein
MKNYIIKICFLAIALTAILSCQPDTDFPNLENPLAIKPSLLSGTWVARKVTQYDQEALDNGFPENVQKQDITSLFPFETYTITFAVDDAGRPGTYIVAQGQAPNFLKLNQGTWTVDHPIFATIIDMSNTAEVTSASFRIKQLEDNVITLQILRNDIDDNTLYSYYEYEFSKAN